VLDYHNFVLTQWLKADAVDFQQVLDEALQFGEYVRADDRRCFEPAARCAQGGEHPVRRRAGRLLDIDHGTYPVRDLVEHHGRRRAGRHRRRRRDIDYVLGICKAYATRVGGGPFPTELDDAVGEGLRERGHEYGATTGRPRRCGWIDLVALKRTQINGINGLVHHQARRARRVAQHQGVHRLRVPRQTS
jgi:adenylosuccinate synthase